MRLLPFTGFAVYARFIGFAGFAKRREAARWADLAGKMGKRCGKTKAAGRVALAPSFGGRTESPGTRRERYAASRGTLRSLESLGRRGGVQKGGAGTQLFRQK